MTAGTIVGIMLALSAWHFFRSPDRGATAYFGQLASACAAMLAIFNLRFDVWEAYWNGVSLAEMHRLMPLWLIPLLTLVLLIWTGTVLFLTKPKR